MPVAHASLDNSSSLTDPPRSLPFPPVTKSHILNCSYHSWYPRYRSITPRSRLVPLPPAFLAYLRADGIVLPPDEADEDWTPSHHTPLAVSSPPLTPPTSVSDLSDNDNEDDDDDEESTDPSLAWPSTHTQIKTAITELGGAVMPKLNWSAPKDACWISATNSMECRSANDVYLLLKSSDFVVHDLEQVFDGLDDSSESESEPEQHHPQQKPKEQQIPYHLILRRPLQPTLNPALEFRLFIRRRTLLCLCQRDLNYYAFLQPLVPRILPLITDFFNKYIRDTFPDENFVLDVYVPGPGYERVWLIDVNPWAERTDPLLFSWGEVLSWPSSPTSLTPENDDGDDDGEREGEEEKDEQEEEVKREPEFRLVNRDDPEAYKFNAPQYSAHKLPKEVVDAGGNFNGEGGVREFLGRWRELERRGGRGGVEGGEEGEDEDD